MEGRVFCGEWPECDCKSTCKEGGSPKARAKSGVKPVVEPEDARKWPDDFRGFGIIVKF